jgi:hypothetical protein
MFKGQTVVVVMPAYNAEKTLSNHADPRPESVVSVSRPNDRTLTSTRSKGQGLLRNRESKRAQTLVGDMPLVSLPPQTSRVGL